MQVVTVKTDTIKPYWRNPRNNAEAVEEVKRSIEKYGFNVPLVLDQDNIIITGHTRYKAMLQLGAKEIPCVYADIDKKKAKEYRIADNKVSELAKWDADLLKTEMREFDLDDLVPGFSQKDMDDLIGPLEPAEVEIPDMSDYDLDLDEDKELSPEEQAEADKRTAEYNKAREKALKEQEAALEKQRAEMQKRQEAFDKKEAEMQNRFTDHSENVQAQYVECICPECGEEFSVDFSEMKRRVEKHGIK
jgi:ParB-like chromosome segregation protein Spo0J